MCVGTGARYVCVCVCVCERRFACLPVVERADEVLQNAVRDLLGET